MLVCDMFWMCKLFFQLLCYFKRIHPSIFYHLFYSGLWGSEPMPAAFRLEVEGVRPGPVASQSQGWYTEKENFSHIITLMGNLESPINRMITFLDPERKLEYPERTHTHAQGESVNSAQRAFTLAWFRAGSSSWTQIWTDLCVQKRKTVGSHPKKLIHGWNHDIIDFSVLIHWAGSWGNQRKWRTRVRKWDFGWQIVSENLISFKPCSYYCCRCLRSYQ